MKIFTKKHLYDNEEYNYIHRSRQNIVIFDYCEHGNLETTCKIFTHKDKRNMCILCAQKIIDNYKNDPNVDFFNKYENVINILKNPSKKISKQLLYLWYPELYAKIQSYEDSYWHIKFYMFLNNIDKIPLCICGNKLAFGKNNKFKDKCEKCNRREGVTQSTQKRSVDMWKNIFETHFNINNPQFSNYDVYRIKITINNKTFIISKATIHRLVRNNIHILSHELITLTDVDIINYTKEFQNNWHFYKMLAEKSFIDSYPHLYKLILYTREKFKDIKRLEEIKFLINNNYVRPKCTMCDNYTSFNISNYRYNTNCEKHKFMVYSSKGEKEVFRFIKNLYNGTILQNQRLPKIGGIDIYMPKLKLAIEYNGLYWHSAGFLEKTRHYDKWKTCNDQGINLLIIWEDDWKNKRQILESIIKNKLNLIQSKNYARDCLIKEVNNKDAKVFLDNNHIQGNSSSSVRLGLYKDEELLSLMTFGKKRMILRSSSRNENEYEMIRFCTKLNTLVIGGFSKLFKYFLTNYKPMQIISYASLDLFSGNIYKEHKFLEVGFNLNYWWATNKRYPRSNFMKYKLIKEGFDPSKTEDEIMTERGYIKIWGAGNLKYEYTGK